MSFYDKLGEGLSNRAGTFVGLIVLITVLMFLASGAFPATYDASMDPTGPAFEAREIITDDFPRDSYTIPFIVEAKGDDILTKEALSEFYANEDALRNSEIYDLYAREEFWIDVNRVTPAVYTIADGVNEVLVGNFNTTLEGATEDMVKVALHFFIQNSPGFLTWLSQDNHTETRDVTIGPMDFSNVTIWHTKAFIAIVNLDYEAIDENFTEQLDLEGLNLDVVDYLKGEEENFKVYGIAIDIQTEINREAATSIVLVFIAVIAILVIVSISLRSGKETLLVAAVILMLLFWMFGSVRLMNLGSSQFIDLLLPIAILSLGVDYAIHSMHRYREEKRKEPDPREAFKRSVTRVGPALLIAMVTTAVAFFSNTSSELEAVQQFGIAAGTAIIWAYVLLGLALPAMRMLPESRRFRRAASEAEEEKDEPKEEKPDPGPEEEGTSVGKASRLWTGIATLGTKPLVVVLVVVLLTVPLAYRGFQIEGKMPVEDFISPESDFVKSLDKMNEHFVTGEEGKILIQADFSDPEMLAAIRRFNENLQDNDEAIYQREIHSLYDHVRNITLNDNVFPQFGNGTLRDHLGIEDADGDGLPDTSEMLERIYQFIIEEDQGVPVYWNGVMVVRYDRLEVEQYFQWNKGPVLDLIVLTVRLPHSSDSSKVAEGREELKEDLDFLKGMGLAANDVTDGKYYIITDVGNYNPFTREEQYTAFTQSMAKSIMISVILCFIVMVVLFKSVKIGVAAIIPMVLVVAWLYGYMELSGHYLNVVTVTIAAISIGVGVDYSIHVTQRFREEHSKGIGYNAALQNTMRSTGNALLGSAGSTFVGFLIIGFSPMTMFSKFGFLTAIMIAMAFVAAILVLPAFLYLTVRKEETSVGQDEEDAGPPSE